MSRRRLLHGRFDEQDAEPLGPLANLVDIMLVFACGLIAALAARSGALEQHLDGGMAVEKGQELPQLPSQSGGSGPGLEPMGRVYRDPETGKLYLMDKANE
ncbi:MAG TPA: hypothetical protein VKA64_10485 [Gammaproteobacteria bacterium]|nr:hypothetical protein [Gammaproteobacteria bacterium]